MEFTRLHLLDYFFRFATIAQLLLIAIYGYDGRRKFLSLLNAALLACIGGYLLLTAPGAQHFFPALRGPSLFLTEIAPGLIWLYTLCLVDDTFRPDRWPAIAKALIALVLSWYFYAFVIELGTGPFHQFNHAISLGLLAHVIYLAGSNLKDDLVEKRRNLRQALMVGISLYFVLLILVELRILDIKEWPFFALLNAGVIWLCVGVIATLYLRGLRGRRDDGSQPGDESHDQDKLPSIPPALRMPYEQLTSLMADGFFLEPDLTLNRLAEEIELPEHQLRELINRHLGFRNFSTYLNSYRIPEACKRLCDLQYARQSILTIAFDLGYGSLSPFNRAFRAQMGCSPSEFRQQNQK